VGSRLGGLVKKLSLFHGYRPSRGLPAWAPAACCGPGLSLELNLIHTLPLGQGNARDGGNLGDRGDARDENKTIGKLRKQKEER
jgi:hypothetical protein